MGHSRVGAMTGRRELASVITVLIGAAYLVSLLPGVGAGTGYDALLDGWLNGAFRVAVVVVIFWRGLQIREDRAAWWLLAAGLASALIGTLGYYLHYQRLETIPYPSWSDIGWVAFYLLAYLALLSLLRTRVRRLHHSMWLDGIVAGFTAAAFAAALVFELAPDRAQASAAAVVMTLVYPAADMLLLTILAGVLVVLGRRAGAMWWWLLAGVTAFMISDGIYVKLVAADAFVPGGPVDIGWTIARICFVVAALQPPRSDTPRVLQGGSVLVVPAICSVAAIALLLYGTQAPLRPWADVLALGALSAALVRLALSFRELESLRDARRQAFTDELTGLPNRRSFYGSLRRAASRVAQGERYAVLLLDLDRFKEVNDSLGHQIGDELLRMVGQRMGARLRGDAILARLGGDEFAVLVPDADGRTAEEVARSILHAFEQPFALGPASLTVDASVGIALAPDDSREADELLQLADLAMYAAKHQRAGVLRYERERDERGRHRLELADQLREGIAANQLVVLYQPKLDLHSDAITGVEALVRWKHPARGLLAPGEFIDVAESSGLMTRLTAAVLGEALAQSRRWRREGLELTVAVNISPSNLVDPGFPAVVAGLLAAHEVPADALILEVTEDVLMEDRERGIAVLSRLRATGAGIAIDDFGTGYSSLAYLADLPVTELKLDRAFVARMTTSRRYTAIVRSTVELAHALGLDLVAEGVEDRETLEALAGSGCDHAQGYHLSRPLPAGEIRGVVLRRAARGSTVSA